MRSPLAFSLVRSAVLAAAVVCCLQPTAPAHASSVNLRWNGCWGDGAVANRTFACNTNFGGEALVGSFVSPAAVHGVITHDFIVDVGFEGSSVPAWWQFKNAGSCRLSSLVISTALPISAVQCIDWASFGPLTTFIAYLTFPNLTSIRGSLTVPSEAAAEISAGQEYFSFQLAINHQKTVGQGACGGCDVGACISLRRLTLHTLPGSFDQFLSIGSSPGDQPGDARALWQLLSPGAICDLATPVRNRTWGEVKALYR